MTKVFATISTLLLSLGLSAQVYISNSASLHIGSDALLYVSQNDVENDGNVYLSGEIDLNGNFINNGLWEGNNAGSPLFQVSGNWTNHGTTDPGQSLVLLKGNAQQVDGNNPSTFYNLELRGALTDVKALNQNVFIQNGLTLNGALFHLGDFTAELSNQNIAISTTGGFIQTNFNGRVRLNFTGSLNQAYVIPFGFDPNQPTERQLGLQFPSAGTYSFALIPGDPTLNGMDNSILQDSVCRIHPDYYWFAESDQSMEVGLETDASEFVFSRLSEWSGTQWQQLPRASLAPPLAFQHKAFTSGAGQSRYVALSSEAPFVDVEPDFEVFKDIKRNISAQGYFPAGSEFLWTPSDELSCDDCIPARLTAKTSQLYTLTVSNDICQAQDQIMVTVLDQPEVFVQNAFSPNSDNLNELFTPQLASYETFIALRIYDRWGGKIFEGQAGWDGTNQGDPVPLGMYLYEIEYRREYSPNDIRTKFARGTVMVVR